MAAALNPLKTHIDPPVAIELAVQGINKARGEHCRAHILVGTPGKTMAWVHQRYLSLSKVNIFVLDEADTMVSNSEASRSLGADTIRIHSMLPPTTQVLFFSATYSNEVVELAKRLVPRAISLRLVKGTDSIITEILQVWIDCRELPGNKLGALQEIFRALPIQQAIVFVERRSDADRIGSIMVEGGFDVSILHSDLNGEQRDRVMEDFRLQRSRVLITTNVLARGVDVESIAVVINYDLPLIRHGRAVVEPDYVTYLHRVRTLFTHVTILFTLLTSLCKTI